MTKPKPRKPRRSKPLPAKQYNHDLERDEYDELDCLKCCRHWKYGPRSACDVRWTWENN